MKTISRYIMTLALLLTAVTGAWATDYTTLAVGDVIKVGDTFTPTADGAFNDMGFYSGDTYTLMRADVDNDYNVTEKTDGAYYVFKFVTEMSPYLHFGKAFAVTAISDGLEVTNIETIKGNPCYTLALHESAEAPITVAWNASNKTGSFTMPAYDVEIAPIYAPTAMFATDGNQVLAPTAAEGIYAESTDSIITPGKVAKIGETENVQGIVMYAVTSTNQAAAPELSAFNATLPTAKDITAAGDVLVWYYIKGADAPQDQTATAENTFNDSEICTEPIKVTVLNNKFDIQFKAANANTIDATQASKATVTVGGTPATVTDGKLEGVKMGSEVKLEAKPGYKFRKVEVKKKASSIVNPVVGQIIGSDGKNYAANATLPDGVDKVAMIAYVNGSNGLAIALADEGANLWVPWMYWDTAVTTAAAHTPAITGGTWKLPSQAEWKQMFKANGGNENSYTGLNTALSTAGGNILTESGSYWSSSEVGENASKVYFDSGNTSWSLEGKNGAYSVRACLAF